LPIRSADRHHRIATFALLALRFPYIRILSIAVAILRHFMLSPPQSRRAADVLRAIRRAIDLLRRPRIAPLPQPAHLARRYTTDHGSV
jgi:hypothetical protein